MCESQSQPTRIATQDVINSLVALEPQARSMTDRDHTKRNEAQALWEKRMSSAYIGV